MKATLILLFGGISACLALAEVRHDGNSDSLISRIQRRREGLTAAKEAPNAPFVEYSRGEDTEADRLRCKGDYETARIKATLVTERRGNSNRVILKYNAKLVTGVGAQEGTEFALLDTTDRSDSVQVDRLKWLNPDRRIRSKEQCKSDKIDAGLSLQAQLDLGDMTKPGDKEGYASLVLPVPADDGKGRTLLQKQIIHWKFHLDEKLAMGGIKITIEEPELEMKNENNEVEKRSVAFRLVASQGMDPKPEHQAPLRSKPENCDKGGEAPGKAALGERKEKATPSEEPRIRTFGDFLERFNSRR